LRFLRRSSPLLPHSAQASVERISDGFCRFRPQRSFMSKALLYDSTLCIGCKQCEQACATQNNLLYNDSVAAEEIQSAHKLTAVLTHGDKFMRRLCMHCENPACASVCPVGAFHKTKEGPVVYDVWKCIGCRYCMAACPFSTPKYEWGSLNPRIRKCTMCPDRVKAGQQTAGAEICPTGATKFGERDDLIREAQDRLGKMHPPTCPAFTDFMKSGAPVSSFLRASRSKSLAIPLQKSSVRFRCPNTRAR